MSTSRLSRYLIEIIVADRGWILEKIASEIKKEAENRWQIFDVAILDFPTGKADLTYFLPESTFRELDNSVVVTHLAHIEEDPGARALFEFAARKSDACITGSQKYKNEIERLGAKNVKHIHYGVDTELFKPQLRIGIVGRTYDTGRKGEDLLAKIYSLEGLELRFTGSGWPSPSSYYSPSDLVKFYQDLDYLLITSTIEGGPVPMLESLASGCEVIAPTDIGFVEDFPHIPFKNGDGDSLRQVIIDLIDKREKLRESVIAKTWTQCAHAHLEFFIELLDVKESTFTELSYDFDDEKTLSVALISHGSENTAKGGPTTRIKFLSENLHAMGLDVGYFHNVNEVRPDKQFDVAHVFNSWPLESAILNLRAARNIAQKVVYSPIALDLWTFSFYRTRLAPVLATKNLKAYLSYLDEISREIDSLRYSHVNGNQIVEGLESHHESLISSCLLADKLIFLSGYERDFLGNLGVDTSKGELVKNGVSNEFTQGDGGLLFQQKFGLNDYVLCVGRIEYRKNQALIAAALRDLPVNIVLIGDEGDSGYLESVLSLSSGNVFHIPRIEDRNLLASAYSGSIAFILPSWSEGAPLAALEALAAGTKLILSYFSGESEYFGSSAHYISPVDHRNLRKYVLEIIEEKNHQKESLTETNFSYSENRHTLDTLNIYRRLITEDMCESRTELTIDISSYIHALKTQMPLTGTFHAERELIARIIDILPSVNLVCFSQNKKDFFHIPISLIRNWKIEDFLILENEMPHWMTKNESVGLSVSRQERGIVFKILRNTKIRRFIGRNLDKSVIGRLIKKKAKSIVFGKVTSVKVITQEVKSQQESVLDGVTHSAARKAGIFLSLGQSWLGNSELASAIEVMGKKMKLCTMVFDISYISGAHFSGWNDNDDRIENLFKVLNQSTYVLTESKLVRNELEQLKLLFNFGYSTEVIPIFGKDISKLEKSAKTKSSFREPYILYVSSFNMRKNHDFIINVWKLLRQSNEDLKEHILLFVGNVQGDERFKNAEFLSDLANNGIKVFSNIEDEQLADLYRNATFTVYPSKQEGWGLPIQESLSFGKICLASNKVPAAQELRNPGIIPLDPDDFFGWCSAILTWIRKDEMRKSFEKEIVNMTFIDWNVSVNRLLRYLALEK